MTQEEIILKIKKCVFYTYMLGNQITDEELDEIGNFIKMIEKDFAFDVPEDSWGMNLLGKTIDSVREDLIKECE